MYPYIYLFGLELSTYGMVAAIGLILMGAVAYILSKNTKIYWEDIILGEIIILLGAFIGSHLLSGIVELQYLVDYVKSIYNNPKIYHYIYEFFKTSGMVFYGGLLGGILFGLIYCNIRKINTGEFSDCFAVGIPLFHFFGRIGCFLSGCCYGIESEFGFTATNAINESCNYVNRFPVQLLEAVLNLVLFLILLLFFLKGILKNNLIFAYFILYGIIRFFDEFLRGDSYRGIWFGFSISQWISLILIVIGILAINYKKHKNKKRRLYYEKM